MIFFQGSALSCMVGQMTYGKRQWERYDSQMRRIIPVMHETMKELIGVIDADTYAFNDYMVQYQIPLGNFILMPDFLILPIY